MTAATRLVRYPTDLAEKLRILSLVNEENAPDILDRLTRGGVEAEFAKLPKDVQKLARRAGVKA